MPLGPLVGGGGVGAQTGGGGGNQSVTTADLDALKQEIVTEMKREIQAAKQEIIDGIKNALFMHSLNSY